MALFKVRGSVPSRPEPAYGRCERSVSGSLSEVWFERAPRERRHCEDRPNSTDRAAGLTSEEPSTEPTRPELRLTTVT